MWFKKLIILLLLVHSSLFGLEYHTDGKPIYEPMDVTVTPMDNVIVYPMTGGDIDAQYFYRVKGKGYWIKVSRNTSLTFKIWGGNLFPLVI